MNAYLPSFPDPENSPFLTGEMIDIILAMIPKHWVETMATAKIEPRNLTIKELVDHLENLELQDESEPEPIPKKKKREFKSGGKGSQRDRKKHPNQVYQTCDLCKLFKGKKSPDWKTHSTAQCKSKSYYEKQLQSGNKRANKGHNSNERSNKRRKKNMRASMRAEIKKSVKAAIKKCESGVSSSSESE